MFEINSYNVPRAYPELINLLRLNGRDEESRAGPVIVMPSPVVLTIRNPLERVLFDEERNCNHFFHLMEAIWMFAGENNVDWLLGFNSRYAEYAEADGIQRGAYGHRWRFHFGSDNLLKVIGILRSDIGTRRAVLAMWDPAYDLEGGSKDYPCNTHLYFRVHGGRLDLTVCNRSNDLIWGMMGANAVHMTLLQEFVASAIGVEVGHYIVFANNMHIYKNMPNFEKIWSTMGRYDAYQTEEPFPLLPKGEDYRRFLSDCQSFVHGFYGEVQSAFLNKIAAPMYSAYHMRKNNIEVAMGLLQDMPANNDWRRACLEWVGRKLSSSTSTELSHSTTDGQSSISEPDQSKTGTDTSPPATKTPATNP